MEIFKHENPLIDTIFHIPLHQYNVGFMFNLIASPSIHDYIILNDQCISITFDFEGRSQTFDSHIVCGKLVQVPKIFIKVNNPNGHMTIIRLNPCGIFLLSGLPVSDFVNHTLSESVLRVAPDIPRKLQEYVDAIDRMMDTTHCHPSYELTCHVIEYVNHNFSELSKNPSKKVAEYFSISESTLHRYFKKYVGLTLSTYLMNLRRKRMIRAIHEDSYDSLIVQENGYYDQSHFINDFKRLFGLSPKQYCNDFQVLKAEAPEFAQFLYRCNNILSRCTEDELCYPKHCP